MVRSFRFGLPLDSLPCTYLPDCGNVPTFLVEAGEIIKQNVEVEGLFGKSGDLKRQAKLKQRVERGEGLQGADVHEVTTLVKNFLRLLPEPVVPCLFHDPLLSSMALEDAGKREEAVQDLCFSLPAPHLSCLRYFMKLLHLISSHVANNKMSPRNLAVVLTPSIIRLKARTKLMSQEEMRALPLQTSLVEHLIRHADAIGTMTTRLHQHTELLLQKKLGKTKRKKKGKATQDSEQRVAVARAALGVVASLHFRPNTSLTVSDTFLVDGPHMHSVSAPASGKTKRKSGKRKKRVQSVSADRGSGSARRSDSQSRRRSRCRKHLRKIRRRRSCPPDQTVDSVSMRSPVVRAWSSAIPFLDDSEDDLGSLSDSDWSDEESCHSDVNVEGGKSSSQTLVGATGLPSISSANGTEKTAALGKETCAMEKHGLLESKKSCPAKPDIAEFAKRVSLTMGTEATQALTVRSLHDLRSSRTCTVSEPIHNLSRKLLNDRGPTRLPGSILSRDKKPGPLLKPSEKFMTLESARTNKGGEGKEATKKTSQDNTNDGQGGPDTTMCHSVEKALPKSDKKDTNEPDCTESDLQNRQSQEFSSNQTGSVQNQKSSQSKKCPDLSVGDECDDKVFSESQMPSKGVNLDHSTTLETPKVHPTKAGQDPPRHNENGNDQQLANKDTSVQEKNTTAQDAGRKDDTDQQQHALADHFLSELLRQHIASNSSRNVGPKQPAGKLKRRLLQADRRHNSRHTQERTGEKEESVKKVTPSQPIKEPQHAELANNQTSPCSHADTIDTAPTNTVAHPEMTTGLNSMQQESSNTKCSSQAPLSSDSPFQDRQRRLSYGMEKMPLDLHQPFQEHFTSATVGFNKQQRQSCGMERTPLTSWNKKDCWKPITTNSNWHILLIISQAELQIFKTVCFQPVRSTKTWIIAQKQYVYPRILQNTLKEKTSWN